MVLSYYKVNLTIYINLHQLARLILYHLSVNVTLITFKTDTICLSTYYQMSFATEKHSVHHTTHVRSIIIT